MLATAQTSSFPEPSGFVDCRSNSRDSGLGKDSDSGSSSSSIQMASQPCNLVPGTQAPARGCQYTDDPQIPLHPCSQSSLQPLDQPVCTVFPMTNYGRNSSHITARQCDPPPRYPNSHSAQREAHQYLKRCEVFSGKSPGMAVQPKGQPELSGFSCRDCKQYYGQRFPVARNVAHCGSMVNPLHYDGSGHVRMPNTHKLSPCRGDVNGRQVRYTTTGMSTSSHCSIPAAGNISDSAVMSEHCATSTCGSGASVFSSQHARGRLVPTERQDELLYNGCRNVGLSCQSALGSSRDNVDVARYRAMQQRYRPYNISADIRHGVCSVPHGGGRNLFYQTSPHSVMQFSQNNELFF